MAKSKIKPITFYGITRLRFKRIRARIRAQADVFTQLNDTGEAKGPRFAVQWEYSEREQTLKMTCTEKAWFLLDDVVVQRIRNLIEAV